MSVFTIPGYPRKPNQPRHKPSDDLPEFGALSNATDEQLADAVIGPAVGDWRSEAEARARFSHLTGCPAWNGAAAGAAWSSWAARSQLVRYEARDLRRGFTRARATSIDWKQVKQRPEKKWTAEDAMAGANRKAEEALTAGQATEVRRIVDERFRQAGIG